MHLVVLVQALTETSFFPVMIQMTAPISRRRAVIATLEEKTCR